MSDEMPMQHATAAALSSIENGEPMCFNADVLVCFGRISAHAAFYDPETAVDPEMFAKGVVGAFWSGYAAHAAIQSNEELERMFLLSHRRVGPVRRLFRWVAGFV